MKTTFLMMVSALLVAVLAACGSSGSPIPPFFLYSSVAVGDLNGDGLRDIAAAYSHTSGAPPHPGFAAVYLQDRARPGIFLPATIHSVGNDPQSIVIGDLNGDGNADIVTANAILSADGIGTSDVSVLLQDPANPGQFLSAASYATGVSPVSVAIGDLDGDGRPDLAAADCNGISLLLQNPALPGTFKARIPISIGTPASSVSIADLDADGRLDLVVTGGSSVLVLLQDPAAAGSFLAPVAYGAGAQPIHAAAGDIDGDGRPDISVANYGSPADPALAGVSVMLQNPATPGSFLPAVGYPTDLRSLKVELADLNGDGRPDLAVANTGTLAGTCPPDCGTAGSSISVLFQNPAAPGQFEAATNYPPAGTGFITSVAVGEMNGDGKPDLVIAQSGGIFIRSQAPLNPGQFTAAVSVPN